MAQNGAQRNNQISMRESRSNHQRHVAIRKIIHRPSIAQDRPFPRWVEPDPIIGIDVRRGESRIERRRVMVLPPSHPKDDVRVGVLAERDISDSMVVIV